MNRMLRIGGMLMSLLCLISLPASAGEDTAARALHLLGYIAADYPATVADEVVVDDSEYREQLEFIGVLQGLVGELPEREGRSALQDGLVSLRMAVEQRQAGNAVASAARNLASQLVAIWDVSLTPTLTPDPASGAALYAQNCTVCHGEAGAGDGPAGMGMQPPPSNFTLRERLDRFSLYDLYNTIGMGVDGTDMAGYAEQFTERQRWDLAVYIAGFSAGEEAPGHFSMQQLAGRTPLQVAASEGEQAAAAFRASRAHPQAEARSSDELLGFSITTLRRSLDAWRDGERDQAYELAVAAYLEGFELVEGALNNVDPEQRKATERAMMSYRQAIQQSLSVEEAQQRMEIAIAALQRCDEVLASGGLSAGLSFLSSLLILLREGVEAILVLAAILAYLRKTGQEHASRSVHAGWGIALLAGFATWALAAWALDISGAQRELLEGGTALFASVILLWVGVWMHGQSRAQAWNSFVRSSLVSSGGKFGFAVLSFIAVYRELFEIILFYETLWLQAGAAGHFMVIAGAGCALLLLLVVAKVILDGSRRLPLATFFRVNAALLCLLSVVFAGQGIAALQEAGILGQHPVAFFELDVLGIHPDALSLGAQLLAIVAIALFYTRSWLQGRQLAA